MYNSKKVVLTSLLVSDISDEYLDTLNDSKYMKYSRNADFKHTFTSQSSYISNFIDSNDLLFGIRNTSDGSLLGTINCYIDFSEMTLDLGFLIFRKHQGKGYATEALGLLISYLEKQFPGMTIIIGSKRENIAMHEVAKKLSFQLEITDVLDVNTNFRFLRKIPKLNTLSSPVIPDYILNAEVIGIAANDAGGAEQLSWLVKNLPQKVLAYISGPANRIFEDSGLLLNRVEDVENLLICDLVITGSGWMSQFEVEVIKEARRQGIPCVTILDHWVNYLERFGNSESNQPQNLAVTNPMALQIAQDKFPDKLIWLLPDFQIRSYKQSLTNFKGAHNFVLVLLEPETRIGSQFIINHKIIQDVVASAISIKHFRGLDKVIIRPHPSQIGDPSLLRLLEKFSGEVEMSKGASLLEDLKISDVVVGLSSYALYISSMCEIDTYSYFAAMNGHWTEWFPKIECLSLPQ